jgi:hypothetical protein
MVSLTLPTERHRTTTHSVTPALRPEGAGSGFIVHIWYVTPDIVVDMILSCMLTWFQHQSEGRQVAFVTAIVGFIGVFIAGIFTPLSPITWGLVQNGSSKSDLGLVHASFEETAEATTLDIEVKNTGEGVAYLREANFNVERTWELWSTIFPARVPVSGNNDVTLTPFGIPYTRTVNLSRSIDPYEVDRFRFTLALNDSTRVDSEKTIYVFLTTVDLVNDEGDKVLSDERLLFVRDLPWQQAGSGVRTYFPYGIPGPVDCHRDASFRAIRAHNARVLDEIGRIEGTKSQSLNKLIRYNARKTWRR